MSVALQHFPVFVTGDGGDLGNIPVRFGVWRSRSETRGRSGRCGYIDLLAQSEQGGFLGAPNIASQLQEVGKVEVDQIANCVTGTRMCVGDPGRGPIGIWPLAMAVS
jgi:hypothetical protein